MACKYNLPEYGERIDIDRKILPYVKKFNRMGIKTLHSCEGHVNRAKKYYTSKGMYRNLPPKEIEVLEKTKFVSLPYLSFTYDIFLEKTIKNITDKSPYCYYDINKGNLNNRIVIRHKFQQLGVKPNRQQLSQAKKEFFQFLDELLHELYLHKGEK